MPTPNSKNRTPAFKPSESLIPALLLSLRPGLAAALLLLAGVSAASASTVTLTASDAAGTTSYNTAGHWNNGAAPSAGNSYFTSDFTFRTPAATVSGSNYIFAGDSLSVDSGGRMLGKTGNNVAGNTTSATITGNFILNGGYFDQAGTTGDNAVLTVAGTLNVNAASGIGAIGGQANGSGSFETLDVTATLTGSAPLQIGGGTINGGQDSGIVEFSAANSYSGTLSVSNLFIANTTYGLLELNHLNALAAATLNVYSARANPVSFASTANTGAFNVGALMGSSMQTLLDTAGSAVTLNVGGNNASTTYSGGLTDGGSLVKSGTGTFTLAGTNTYTGNTTVNAGTLALAAAGSLSNSPTLTVAGGATLDVSANSFSVAAAQILTGSGTVKGPVNTVAGATISAGINSAYGTNSFTSNLTLAPGAVVALALGQQAAGPNDSLAVGGNLNLNSTTLLLTAPSTSVNLDSTADYTLITVAGTITGTAASTPQWNVAPQNAANYSVVTSGNSIKLHYTVSAPPTGTGSASPATVSRNQATLITVTVNSSSHPISTVTLNASPAGGSATLPLLPAGGGTYTNTLVVGAAVAPGSLGLVATITDSSGLTGTTPTFSLNVTTASETWDGAGPNNNWSTSPNWAGGAAPGLVGDTLTFAGTSRLTPNMDANYSVTDVNFDSTAGSFVIGTSGNSLTLTGGGVVNNSANTESLNVPITTASPETFNAASGNLILNAITNAGNLVSVSGQGDITVNGTISGTGGLDQGSSATNILTGTNTFSGPTSIDTGVLQLLGSGSLGAGNYAGNITNNGALEFSSSVTQILSGAISAGGSVIVDGPGTLSLQGANSYAGDTAINGGVLQIAAAGSLAGSYAGNFTDNGLFQYSSSANQTLVGVISGTGALLKDGTGTLTLNGANSYAGATVVTAGNLVYSPNLVAYPTVNSLAVGNAAVTVNAGTGSTLPLGNLTLNNNAALDLAFDFSGGNPTAPAVSVLTNLVVAGTDITINVAGVGPALGQFPLIAYAGTPLPNLANFALGGVPPGVTASLVNNQNAKTIDLLVSSQLTPTWVPLTGTDAFGTSSFNSAGLWANGNPPTAGDGYYSQNFTLRSPADTNVYTFGGLALSIDTGGRFLLKSNGGQMLTVNNLYLNGGIMDFANTVSDNLTETVAGSIILQPGLTSYLGSLGGGGGEETFYISANISGGGNVQLGGSAVNAGQDVGNIVLTGASTYTGNTLVAGGALLVNGSLGNTALTVATNAILGGSGSIGGPVNVQPGASLMPGIPARGVLTNALGTLTVNNTVTLSGAASLRINRALAPNSDSLAAPAIVVNPGAALSVNNLGSTNLAAGDSFKLFGSPVSGFATITLPALPGTNLVWTNELALNGTIAVLSSVTLNPNPTNITYSVSAGTLSLSWPADHTGWILQVQTNAPGLGLGTNWVDVPGSAGANTYAAPISTANGSVFYRLIR